MALDACRAARGGIDGIAGSLHLGAGQRIPLERFGAGAFPAKSALHLHEAEAGAAMP